jgi:predicted PurR-regulated permease PerM
MIPENPITPEKQYRFEDKLFATVKLTLAAISLVFLLSLAADVFLLLFAGILVAIFISSLAKGLSRMTSLPYGWSVAITCLVLVFLLAILTKTSAPGVAEQLEELTTKVPQALNKIKAKVQEYSWSEIIFREAKPDKLMESSGQVFNRITGAVSGFIGGIASFGIILFIGLYGAAEPRIYKNGFLHLIPTVRRPRVEQVMEEVGSTLQWWIIGKCISMASIGVFTTLGLWIMDIPWH